MTDALWIQLGDFIADGVTPDANGLIWSLTAIDGWYDSTAIRSATQEREPVGEVLTLARENARPVVLHLDAKLEVPVSSRPLGDWSFYATETIKKAGRCVHVPALLTVTDPFRTTHAMVRRTGVLHTAFVGKLVIVQAQIPLLAEDPRRYGNQHVWDLDLTGTDTTMDTHVIVGGEVQTPFSITFRGPATNPALVSHSLGPDSAHRPRIQWVGTLPDITHHVVVNTRTGEVTHDGSPTTLAAGSQLFELIAGDNFLTYSRTGGSGLSESTIEFNDAYD